MSNKKITLEEFKTMTPTAVLDELYNTLLRHEKLMPNQFIFNDYVEGGAPQILKDIAFQKDILEKLLFLYTEQEEYMKCANILRMQKTMKFVV